MKLGVVIISHSALIAEGASMLIDEVARDVSVTYAGGTDENGIGTSFDKVLQAIESNVSPNVLAFFDLGSARMNLEMASEMSEKEVYTFSVPIVEGAYTAAALIQAGASFEAICEQLDQLMIVK